MRYLLFFVVLVSYPFDMIAQDETQSTEESYNEYPTGLYVSIKDFIDKSPSKNLRVEARDLFQPKNRIFDPYIDNCYFHYKRTNKRVKDIFAISYDGSLYINIKAMRKHMDKKDRRQKMDYKDSFIRVVDQGNFLFLEGHFRKGGGIGLSIGAGPIGIGTGGPREEMKGIIFDFGSMQFDVIRDCKDFNEFIMTKTNQRPFKCDNKYVPPSLVEQVVAELNGQP